MDSKAMNNRTPLPQRPMPRSRGFTLVELLVTMVIAAILAAIAIPAYSNYVRKARRTEAKSAVLDIASLEERWFSTNNSYTDDPTKLGYTGAAGTAFTVGSGYYTVLVSKVDATTSTALATYTIVATATGDQLKDTQCRSFQVTNNGAQTAADSASAVNTNTCWR
jgi:type IV pilus assembly protein PilE